MSLANCSGDNDIDHRGEDWRLSLRRDFENGSRERYGLGNLVEVGLHASKGENISDPIAQDHVIFLRFQFFGFYAALHGGLRLIPLAGGDKNLSPGASVVVGESR